MNDLEILFPSVKQVRVGRRVVSIKPVEFRNFDAFGRAAGEMLAAVATGKVAHIYALSKNASALHAVLLSCTDLSKWRVDRLPMSVAVELMLHVIAMNSRFFDQALVNAAHLLAGESSPKS